MRLSTKGRYAVSAMFDLVCFARNYPISAKEISERQKIPLFYLEQILLRLKKKALVKAIKGPAGGYLLAKNPKKITIGEIIEAADAPVALAKCIPYASVCLKSGCCSTRKLWESLSKKFSKILRSITLADLCEGRMK
ncbi:MAG: RrF2 family transcriptional regulator [Candidatus Margulisiibacteriota bacterium]